MTAAAPVAELSPVLGTGRAAAEVASTWKQLASRRPDPVASIRSGRLRFLSLPPLADPRHRAGHPLTRAVIAEMDGLIRIGRWLPFRAIQLHAPLDGYLWAARAALGPLRISGFDRYAAGTGEMRWRLAGRIPVISATGPDLDRSAAGRAALDAVFVPTAFLTLAVSWRHGPGPGIVTAEWTVGRHVVRTELGIGPYDAINSVTASLGQPRQEPLG